MSALNIFSGKAMVFERERRELWDRDVLDTVLKKVRIFFINKPACVFLFKNEKHRQAFLFYMALVAATMVGATFRLRKSAGFTQARCLCYQPATTRLQISKLIYSK